MRLDPPKIAKPTKEKQCETLGVGGLLQIVGLFVCFLFFPFGLIAGIILMVIGHKKSYVYRCGKCRNRIDKEIKICPTCKAQYQD